MCHRLSRRTADADFYFFGLTQHPRSKTFNLGRNRRRKEQSLALFRAAINDLAHVRHESHVQHAVHFVEHKQVHVVQMERSLPQEIQQPTRRCDHDVNPTLELLFLFTVADATEYDGGLKIGETSVVAKSRFDLGGQFTSRFEHKATAFAVCFQQCENRQSERSGLARTCLGRTNEILTGQDDRDRANLNGRWLDVTGGLHAAQRLLRKS